MGIGGQLMWTALAKELYEKNGKKTCFTNDYKKSIKENIWLNNPHISFDLNPNKNNIIYHDYLHTTGNLPERHTKNKWNVSQHTIVSRCKYFGIDNPEVRCYMYFTEEEENYIQNIVKTLPEKFVVIEPHAKTSWCKHKQYPLDKWQKIVNHISNKIPVIQISMPKKKVLNNVIDLSDKIRNFREAVLLLRYANLFISTEGGLMHGANCVNCKSLIVFFPMFDPKFTKYDNVVDVWVKSENHYNCFIEKECKDCMKLMNNHNEQEIIKKFDEIWGTNQNF
jgi:ADP-heptose:LPS heptosyltransferase